MAINKLGLRLKTLGILVCFVLSNIVPINLIKPALAEEQATIYSAQELANRAVTFINDKYQEGENIDGYTAYVLSLAGEDLTDTNWTRNGKQLRGEVEDYSDLLGDNNSLLSYLLATQNSDGSFGPFANEYGTKAPLEALGTISDEITVGMEVYNQVQASITTGIDYFKSKYKNGSVSYSVDGWNFDYRCIEALTAVNEDISVSDWVYNGTSLKDEVIASANTAAANPSESEVVLLSKELRALYAVDLTSNQLGTLANAIAAKQNEDGSFGSSIYDHVTVLIALGKTGNLFTIHQTKAFEYLNGFKHNHSNDWGSPTGVAWGGYYDEESDLSAQVITALSYFDGALTEGTDVYEAINNGLTYLLDIQDSGTAAISAEWDSTFATAETLIALKSIGKGYDYYAGTESNWVKKSTTKAIAQYLLAVNNWNDTERRDRLANLLINRQKAENPSKGSFDNSVYSDMWAYIALGEAGKIAELNVTDAKEYILSKQSEDGSWGETFDIYYPDFLSTVQAIQALNYLPGAESDVEIQAAIDKALNYVKGLQQTDGGTYVLGWDDPAVDNSQLIVTLFKLGIDPEGILWTQVVDSKRVNPVSYLIQDTMNEDCSFGTSKNLLGATEALYAYSLQQEVDVITTVKNGVQYLYDQYISDNTNDMYKQFGGHESTLVLALTGEDLSAGKWTKVDQSLEDRIIADALSCTAETEVTQISKTLISLSGLQSDNASECSRLLGLLIAKQQAEGNFADGVIYNEILPYMALTVADGWNLLSSENQTKAKNWLLNAQTKDAPETSDK